MEAVENPGGRHIGKSGCQTSVSFCREHFALFEDYCKAYHDVSTTPREGENLEERLKRTSLEELKNELMYRTYVHDWWFREADLLEEDRHSQTIDVIKQVISERENEERMRVKGKTPAVEERADAVLPTNIFSVLPVSPGKKFRNKGEASGSGAPVIETKKSVVERDVKAIKLDIALRAWNDMCEDLLDRKKPVFHKMDRTYMYDKIEKGTNDFDEFSQIYQKIDILYFKIKTIFGVIITFKGKDPKTFMARANEYLGKQDYAEYLYLACRDLATRGITIKSTGDQNLSKKLMDLFFESVRDRPAPTDAPKFARKENQEYENFLHENAFFSTVYPLFPAEVFCGFVGDPVPYLDRLITSEDYTIGQMDEGIVLYFVYVFCNKGITIDSIPNRMGDFSVRKAKETYFVSDTLNKFEFSIERAVSWRNGDYTHTRVHDMLTTRDGEMRDGNTIEIELNACDKELSSEYCRLWKNVIDQLHVHVISDIPPVVISEDRFSKWIISLMRYKWGLKQTQIVRCLKCAQHVLKLQQEIARHCELKGYSKLQVVQYLSSGLFCDGEIERICEKYSVHPEYVFLTSFLYYGLNRQDDDISVFATLLVNYYLGARFERDFFINNPQTTMLSLYGSHETLLRESGNDTDFITLIILLWSSDKTHDICDMSRDIQLTVHAPELAAWKTPNFLTLTGQEKTLAVFARGNLIRKDGKSYSGPDTMYRILSRIWFVHTWEDLHRLDITRDMTNTMTKCLANVEMKELAARILSVSEIMQSVLHFYKTHEGVKLKDIENPLLGACYFLVEPIDIQKLEEDCIVLDNAFYTWLFPEIYDDIKSVLSLNFEDCYYNKYDPETLAAINLFQYFNGKPMPKDVEGDRIVEMPKRKADPAKLEALRQKLRPKHAIAARSLERLASALGDIEAAHKETPMEELMQAFSLLEKCRERLRIEASPP